MEAKITPTKPQGKISFPCLMESKGIPDLIVCFNAPRSGMVVSETNSLPYPLGHYSLNWTDAGDFDYWQPFNGTIHLSNQ